MSTATIPKAAHTQAHAFLLAYGTGNHDAMHTIGRSIAKQDDPEALVNFGAALAMLVDDLRTELEFTRDVTGQ